MTTEPAEPRVEPRYLTPPSLEAHMRTCNRVGCLRCAGDTMPHFGIVSQAAEAPR